MAQKLDFTIPFNDLRQYVPQNLRNTVVDGLLDNLFNRFMTHDEAVPLYGYIGRKPSSSEDKTPRIPQLTVERDINAVTPVLNFKVGSERFSFTVQDIINKAELVGISDDQSWLYSQGNNFKPPVDFDKFTNFFNYYWVARALDSTPEMAWNPEKLPEYYVIERPQPGDLVKLNVQASTGATDQYVLTGSGFIDQVFTVNFLTSNTFTITPSASLQGPLGAYLPINEAATFYTLPTLSSGLTNPPDDEQTFVYEVTGPAGTFRLLEFKITREPTFDSSSNHTGYIEYAPGDQIEIDTTYLSLTYSVNFAGSLSIKPKLSGVKTLNQYQVIDGVQLREGDRVLVQGPPAISGIYDVSSGEWVRAADFDVGTWSVDAEVFAVDGTVNGGKLWKSSGAPGAWSWTQVGTTSKTNDWQEGNLWVKSSDLDALGIDRSLVIQATRPIIEYSSTLQLNELVVAGIPADAYPSTAVDLSNYKQEKTEFNQLPLFDLFRYDGTHAGLVSSIFYYEEDPSAAIDTALQRRIKLSSNDSADFIFNHGCVDQNGQLLFFKEAGEIKTVWHAGYTSPEVVDVIFAGDGDGTIGTIDVSATTQQQVWTLIATSSTTFEIAGSKLVVIPAPYNQVTVGVPYDNGELSFTITAGSTPFSVGDSFTIRVANLERPRYVFRDTNDAIYDLFGGQAGDQNGVGAWQVPRTFVNNPYNESREEVVEGSVYSHFRSILSNQIEGQPVDFAFGGNIKLWSEQQTLLASLLMQRDMTPISMIEQAQKMYEAGLNAIRDIYIQEVVEYFATGNVVTAGEPEVADLLAYILNVRSTDSDVRTVLFDTTAGVIGFPATLPQLGMVDLVQPVIAFDPVIGRSVFIHHDGHKSVPYIDGPAFLQEVLGTYVTKKILRSDGNETDAIGSFTTTPPLMPYRGELWLLPTGELLAYDVLYDTTAAPPVAEAGKRWYQRGTNTLYESDGSAWLAQPDPLAAWKQVFLAETLNDVMLRVEQQLHDHINPNQRKYDFSAIETNPIFVDQLKRELFTFAAVNGLDPLATNYSPTDPFTWNYSNATIFAPVATPTVPGRWYNALIAHQQTVVGVIPTERPNLEPWKLLGFSDFATWWSSLTAGQQASYTPYAQQIDGTFVSGGQVRAVKNVIGSTTLSGLPTIDGVALSSGDVLLLAGELSPENNGAWIVSSGGWSRAATPLLEKTYFTVAEGEKYADTVWAVTADVAAVGTDPVNVMQVRQWTEALWADISAAVPSLKLSVNPYNDDLLPPFVSVSSAVASYALTNTIPTGIALPFEFGEGSPVEEVWSRAVDYGYARAKALFRFDPLAFLGFCWGFNWVERDGILYDGFDLNMPGHKRFMLHGESVSAVERVGEFTFSSITGSAGESLTINYDAYDSTRRQNFSVRTSTGTVIGYLQEGITSSVSGSGFTLTDALIEDRGIPFRVGDSFTLTVGSPAAVLVPAPYHQILGFGQIFTNALRAVSVDTKSSYAVSAYRGWDVNMGHRAGGLVATDDLKVLTESDTLNPSSYSLVLKRNDGASDIWIQGLRISVLQYGQQEIVNGIQQNFPAGDGSDWVFRIEGYNPRYLDISYYTFTPTTSRVTFYALDQTATDLEWTQPVDVDSVAETQLPITITGVQNVVDFLFGYSRYCTDQGWELFSSATNNIDAETGRVRNWQLEIEKYVDRVYRGIELGQGHIVNPFLDAISVRQQRGLLARFYDTALFDVYSHAAVYDVEGRKLKSTDINVVRGNTVSTFSSTIPMFSAHALIDEYEHLFIFNNYINGSDASGLLYEPFSGSRSVTYRFNGRRQNTGTLRPELGGYYLVGDEVRLNLQASTDNIANYYDANRVFENELTSGHALALLGFNQKEYFDDLDITKKSQFNFWRGLVQSKGTNLSIDAYLNNDRFKDAKLDEYWAYKVAEYGDARQKTYPELKVQVADSLQQFTQLQFDAQPGDELPNFIQISRFDEARWFSIDDLDHDAYFKAEPVGAFGKQVTAGEVVQLPFIADELIGTGSMVKLNSTTLLATVDESVTITGYGWATPRYNPIKLFNYVDSELIEEIPLWHPARGLHNPVALGPVNTISSKNPAKYNNSTLVEGNNSYDPLRPWSDREVGRIWFDTSNLMYVPYWDEMIFPNRDERLSRWGALADFATIDVYEWVRSTVPPSEYDALSQEVAGNADIDASIKASGQAALQQTYSRNRIWSVRPVAWSYSPVPTDVDWGDSPPMKFSRPLIGEDLQLVINGSKLIFQQGSFAQYGIMAGDSIGTWQHGEEPRPLSEGIINDDFSQVLWDTTTDSEFENADTVSTDFTVSAAAVEYTDTRLYGQVLFSHSTTADIEAVQIFDPDGLATTEWDLNYYVSVSDLAGKSERILAYTVRDTGTLSTPPAAPTITVTSGQTFTYSFPLSGLQVTVVSNASGVTPAGSIALAIKDVLSSNISLYDSATVDWLVAAPNGSYINDDADPLFAANLEVGWRVWTVPTQAQLNADGKQPVSSWKPYIGDAQVFSPDYDELQAAVEYLDAPLTLNDDTVVERYETSWSEWTVLENKRVRKIATATGPVSFDAAEFGVTKFDSNSTSVYINGISQLKAAYTISSDLLTVNSVQQGFTVDVIVRPYAPSEAELAFDPDVEEDYTYQRHYKRDYEYVSLETRDSDGNFSTTYYYFWVKNKSTAARGKSLSLQSITQLLRDGPSNYMTFQHLLPPVTTPAPLPWRYDAITVSGLSYAVTKDDTFKLRFTRDFTLRDDPRDLDLKNTHTEWSLMRPGQKTRIPEKLWLKLTDSAAGTDAAGNAVPSLRRSLYDERNGTASQFGFGPEQTLAPSNLLISSLASIIVNTKLTIETPDGILPDYIQFIDDAVDLRETDSYENPVETEEAKAAKVEEVRAMFFSSPTEVRATLTKIWTAGSVAQVNEVFFAALEDVIASNYELTDIFKTSRISLYSIQEKRVETAQLSYE